jgi:hypothetical protein
MTRCQPTQLFQCTLMFTMQSVGVLSEFEVVVCLLPLLVTASTSVVFYRIAIRVENARGFSIPIS